MGEPADESAILSIATEIEGHPDNVTPAVVGGLVLSSMEDDGSILYRKINWPEEWAITVCIPDVELATEISRSVLPESVPMQDAVFNTKRMGMLIQAIHTKDEELIKAALTDKLHQPYRAKLVPWMDDINQSIRHDEDIFGCVLSGAGSAVLVVSKQNATDRVRSKINEVMTNLNVKAEVKTLKVENDGATIVS